MKKGKSSQEKWDSAISAANKKLMEGRAHVAKMKAVIRLFQKRKEEGASWPDGNIGQNG
jgi:hypothetical protein